MKVDDEDDVMKNNEALLVDGDDSIVFCKDHDVKKRYGDLDPAVRIAILNGWDVKGERCIMEDKK